MTHWHSLFLSSEATHPEALISTLQRLVMAQGYTCYDPFDAVPGMSYPQTIRLFVAPEAPHWTRILVEVTQPTALEMLLQALSEDYVVLAMLLAGNIAKAHVYQDGRLQSDLAAALQPYLRSGVSAARLQQVLDAEDYDLSPLAEPTRLGDISLEDLPEDLRGMVAELDTGHRNAGTIFKRLTQRFLGNNQAAADEFLQDKHTPDWNSQGGQFLRALVMCLTLPDSWREPDFTTLRIAYSLHKRRERRPKGMQLPGDAEAMAAVADALRYAPVYAGK